MNALEIPELKGKNPLEGRRQVFRADPHPTWKRVLNILMEKFPEVQSVSYARVKPGALERNAFATFYLMVFFLDEYAPVFRLRELELSLMRLFRGDAAPVRFAATRETAPESAVLYPFTPLLDRVKQKGSILYKRPHSMAVATALSRRSLILRAA
ncbi:MAG: hypothetical protein JNM27_04985 [Leptospirales bacterium]|nr:hypothetical protein [Leptospirales bacterium]